jgi:poly-gamma-glutamate synthesis protein (capsule biosynthesis protein)
MNKSAEILITGDFYGGYRTEEVIKNKNYNQLYNDFLPIIRNADFAITNLEAPLLINGTPIKKTGPAIKAVPETIDALKFAGFNLLTLANNHIMDYGAEGLINTIKLCGKKEISIVGAGENHQKASQTIYKQINGINIAFINVSENEWSTTNSSNPGAHPLNPVANYYKIKEAEEFADYLILIVHGGHEMYNLPSPRMKETYRFFVDAGADVIIGHHTHCYSGYEIYKGKTIFYSLGNFLFDSKNYKPDIWYFGFAVRLNVTKTLELTFEIIPYKQSYIDVGIKILNKLEKDHFNNDLKKINAIIQDDFILEQKFNAFINNELAGTYKNFLEPLNFKVFETFQKLGFMPSFLNKKKKRLYLNLIRCESHRDVVIKLLADDWNQ